jgi:cell division transport system permease protein
LSLFLELSSCEIGRRPFVGPADATPAGDQLDALFGGLTVGWPAVIGILLTIRLGAALTAVTSRLAVYHFLKVFD